ncbi:polyadenylate-binding protein-interacting protein 3-like [Olea europaea var. sylvestris]|uniref:polyadenylate-binding protein-interacting protein 3-like n=1 Tax=Olea europaea var. sylvestris TaxID=158386 RepID=UPI000C1D20AC|nr:polyadenylate-binding protein-interacting protein 3-like [Olea europaea var. sylvestris]XP_022853200.1 polyadenylate-binding protein-interacting protein 3-like [Olea europaea var. sylvestris]XP_022853201.1 polyadenylate-binding protein-interacting protein 3-like [Olea europaea var. sylvestris]
MQPVVQPRSSNGYGRRKSERDIATKFDSKLQAGKTNSSRFTNAGKGGGLDSPSRDRMIYLTTCLIGHQVEVQVSDGSVFSGIFHATNADKDFGIVLKMAHLIKDGSQGQKNIFDSVNKTCSRTLIISTKELVQVIAKGVPVTRDGLTNELQHDEQQELMTDSCISQSRHVDLGRELEPWVPDADDPGCPELENIFDGPWNRGWDQFEANETLFGVKSTFNEEFYTTKLEKGPQMRDLEREAKRIAREIEGEDTHDLHLAEERGIQLTGNLEIDEETRFSSVYREVDDSGYDEIEDILLNSRNDETFGDVSGSVTGKPFTDLDTGKINCEAQISSRPLMDEVQSSQTSTCREFCHSSLEDNAHLLSTELLPKNTSAIDASRLQDDQSTERVDSICSKENIEKPMLPDHTEVSKAEDMKSSLRYKKESSDKGGLSPNATAYDPPNPPSKGQEKASSSNEYSQGAVPSKPQGTVTSHARPSSSVSSTSDRGGATSTAGRGLSPSSSVGSLSSEKSTLNPYAKEFKLNPNAKSFMPSQAPLRPASPVAADGSFYYQANMGAVSQMHGMPVSIGIGPSFSAQQPIMFNPQATQMPQPYFHPNGPQYGQQMIIGQPRQFLYMPTYPPEMPYKGRDF